MDERLLEQIESIVIQDAGYQGYQDEAVQHLEALIKRLDPIGREVLQKVEDALALAQGEAVRSAYLQGLKSGRG